MASDRLRRIVIGIGNPDRGDDAAGRIVAQLLRGTLPEDVDLVEHDGETTGLLERFDGATKAFLIDACVSGAPTGTVRRYDVAVTPLPRAAFGVSSHGLGLSEAVELARTLGHLPRSCIVYAIEGESFAVGAPLSPPVATAVADVAARLRVEIDGRSAVGG
jgi:hydrogenase maturation protease